MQVDDTELAALVRACEAVPPWTAMQVPRVVDRAALQIKNAWVQGATRTAGAHGKHYPRSIDYETHWRGTTYEAEVGPRVDRPQGSMGEGFEYGSINQPPHLDGDAAALAEAPRYEQALADVLGRALT